MLPNQSYPYERTAKAVPVYNKNYDKTLPPECLDNDIQIFILAYNSETLAIAKEKFKYSWAHPLLLPNATKNNPIYENIVYNEYDTLIKPLVKSKYVGFLSYKAHLKMNVDYLHKFISLKKHLNYDVSFFICRLRMADRSHPFLQQIWREAVKDDVGTAGDHYVSYCNFWCLKKQLLESYALFFKSILPKIMNHPKILENARYNGKMTNQQLRDIGGKPYYTHIPFVLERIPYAWAAKLKLTINKNLS